ncbi:MAG: double zinc ribbon domain-containing protein [Spirochaetaceae bacterium]|jgi:ComF family protein|nr:double zinc ribbon domain-containing protein [Spirochaetaceae bacterium]
MESVKTWGGFEFFKKLVPLVREFVFPSNCPLCEGSILNSEDALRGLCSRCADIFKLDRGHENGMCCEKCGKPLISERNTCLRCRERSENLLYDSMIVLYPYTGMFLELLHSYKFGKHRSLRVFFAQKLLEGIEMLKTDESFVLVPVPPRSGKIKSSGWDQIESIAEILQKHRPLERCLKRLPSKSQKTLNRSERYENLKGKIICTTKVPDNIILFDDVFTTGATMNVCAGVLKEAGAKNVSGICLFYD